MSDVSFPKTDIWTDLKNWKTKTQFPQFGFQKPTLAYWGRFFTLSHWSSNMIGSTVKVFFFMSYLYTSSSESLRLTISWTNSARKYIILASYHRGINAYKRKKRSWKKPKPQLNFYTRNWTENYSSFAKPNQKSFFCQWPYPHYTVMSTWTFIFLQKQTQKIR